MDGKLFSRGIRTALQAALSRRCSAASIPTVPFWGRCLLIPAMFLLPRIAGDTQHLFCLTIARCAQAAVRDQHVVRRAAWRSTPITELSHPYSLLQSPPPAVAAALAPVPPAANEAEPEFVAHPPGAAQGLPLQGVNVPGCADPHATDARRAHLRQCRR